MINEEKKLAMELAIKYYAEIGDVVSIDDVIGIAKKIEGYLGSGFTGNGFKMDDSGTAVFDNFCVRDFLRKCGDEATGIELSQPVGVVLSVMSDLLKGTKFEKIRSGNIESSKECHTGKEPSAKPHRFKAGDTVRTISLQGMSFIDTQNDMIFIPFAIKTKIAEKEFVINEEAPGNAKYEYYSIYDKEKGTTYVVPKAYLVANTNPQTQNTQSLWN